MRNRNQWYLNPDSIRQLLSSNLIAILVFKKKKKGNLFIQEDSCAALLLAGVMCIHRWDQVYTILLCRRCPGISDSHGWESALVVLARTIKRFNRDSANINPVVLSSPYQPTLYGSKTENTTGLFWILTYSFPLSAEIAVSASDSLARVTKANPLLRPERSSVMSLYIQFQHQAYKGLVKVSILIIQLHPIQKSCFRVSSVVRQERFLFVQIVSWRPVSICWSSTDPALSLEDMLYMIDHSVWCVFL